MNRKQAQLCALDIAISAVYKESGNPSGITTDSLREHGATAQEVDLVRDEVRAILHGLATKRERLTGRQRKTE